MPDLVFYIMAAVLGLVGVIASGRLQMKAYARALADGSFARKHVYVEEDGSAWELSPEDIEYLSTPFHPGDGARPYIKPRYRSMTPDEKIHGYLLRRRLPRGLAVNPAIIPSSSREEAKE